ncbi:hypothetical protein C8J56DRAFT_1054059 [Mycena floridula]|nr:hypothetical protein C8J56DRAFT_1054059 [Mycena floridula]
MEAPKEETAGYSEQEIPVALRREKRKIEDFSLVVAASSFLRSSRVLGRHLEGTESLVFAPESSPIVVYFPIYGGGDASRSGLAMTGRFSYIPSALPHPSSASLRIITLGRPHGYLIRFPGPHGIPDSRIPRQDSTRWTLGGLGGF